MTTEQLDATELATPSSSSGGTGDEPEAFELVDRKFEVSLTTIAPDDITDIGRRNSPGIDLLQNGHWNLEGQKRHQRATADALMDPACLYLLNKFGQQQSLDINKLEQLIAGPAGWLKLCLLVRADLIEIIGTDLRMTEFGNEALDQTKQIIASS